MDSTPVSEPQVLDNSAEPPLATGGFTPADIRRNMKTVILLNSLFATGWAELFLALSPLWIYLGASNTTIGLINAASMTGLFGMFISPWISKLFPVKKWYLLVAHLPYLLPLGLAGLGVIFSGRIALFSPALLVHVHILNHDFTGSRLLLFVVGMLVVHNFFGGFVSLPHQEYIAACIPMSHRGRYTGLSGSFSAAVAWGATAVGGVLLLKVPQPICYGFLMIMTWAICQSGYVVALFAKEKPVPRTGTPYPWSREMLGAAWNNKLFVRTMIARALGQLTFLPAAGFILYYGLRDLKMIPATVALGAIFKQIARILTSAPTGWVIDRQGAKNIWALAPLGSVIVYAAVLVIPGSYGVYIAGVLATALVTSTWAAGDVLLYGLPRPEHRPGYYTIQSIMDTVMVAFGGVLMGKMYDLIPYRTGFAIMLVVSLLAFPVMKWLLHPLSADARAYS